MKSDHNSLRGAGNQHSPAPSIPVYAICELCDQPEEADRMRDGMCPECLGMIREGLRVEQERQRALPPLNWPFAVAMAAVVAAIMWRWLR